VRLTRCGICGALKAEGQPCRFCDEASPEDLPGDGPRTAATPASSGRDAWRELQESGMDEFATAQDAGGADSEGEPTAEPVGAAKARRGRSFVIVASLILIGVAALVVALTAGRDTSYEGRVRSLSSALGKASAELAPLLGRGPGLSTAELMRVRALSEEISGLTRQGWALRPTVQVVEAHSYFTGALTSFDSACGEARSFVDYALHVDRPEADLALEALATLSAAHLQLEEAARALEREPAASP